MSYTHKPIPLSTDRQTRQTRNRGSKSHQEQHHTADLDILGLSSLSTCRQGVAPQKQPKETKPVHLQLLGNGSMDKFIGVYAVLDRLPELLRWPGEGPKEFCERALHHVKGTGALWAKLMYASDVGPPTPPLLGPPTEAQA
jgi:hypothetical protein